MRRLTLLSALLPLALAACDNPNETVSFSAVGSWRSVNFAPARIEMTLVETARSTNGAGYWAGAGEVLAFRVTGAHADPRISILLDFDGRPDITFHGEFQDTDPVTMVGQFFGGGFRGEEIRFEKVPASDR